MLNTSKKKKKKKATYCHRAKEPVLDDHMMIEDTWRSLTVIQRATAIAPFRDETGRGLFTRAIRNREYELVENLLEVTSVEVNEQDIYGNTALHHAVLIKDMRMIRSLLESNRILTNLVNHDGLAVFEMLYDLEETGVFPKSFHHYCYSRLHYTKYQTLSTSK